MTLSIFAVMCSYDSVWWADAVCLAKLIIVAHPITHVEVVFELHCRACGDAKPRRRAFSPIITLLLITVPPLGPHPSLLQSRCTLQPT